MESVKLRCLAPLLIELSGGQVEEMGLFLIKAFTFIKVHRTTKQNISKTYLQLSVDFSEQQACGECHRDAGTFSFSD